MSFCPFTRGYGLLGSVGTVPIVAPFASYVIVAELHNGLELYIISRTLMVHDSIPTLLSILLKVISIAFVFALRLLFDIEKLVDVVSVELYVSPPSVL